MTRTTEVDVQVENHGSIFLFQPFTEEADDWIARNVHESAMWYAGALAVDHRYARELADGMLRDGLEVV